MSIIKRVCYLLVVSLITCNIAFIFHYIYSTPNVSVIVSPKQDRTLYDLLEVPLFATEAEVRAGYRRQLKRFHPDKDRESDKQEATEMVYKITQAREILTDRGRCLYDFHLGGNLTRYKECKRRYQAQDEQRLDALREELRKREEVRKAQGTRKRRNTVDDDENDNDDYQESDGFPNALVRVGENVLIRIRRTVAVAFYICVALLSRLAGWPFVPTS